MDNPIIPEIFILITCCVFLIFLWDVVLAKAKKSLRVEDHATATFWLLLISLPVGGIAIHYGYSIFGLCFGISGPF